MTQSELYALLTSTGLPIAYGFFTSPKTPPFITYQYAYSNDFMADGINYAMIGSWLVHLYTNKKDSATEAIVEQALKSGDIRYSKTETWLDDEKMYQIIYEFQLI